MPESRPLSRFVAWLRRREYVVIDAEDGATLDRFGTREATRIFLQTNVDPERLAVLIYERGRRVGLPICRGGF